MKRTNLLGILLTAIILLMSVAVAGAQQPPSQPSSFWGTVQVNGANVADGTLITASINGTQQAQTTTQMYNGSSVFSINLPNGNEGDTISFQVAGSAANETGTWHAGTNVELNLSAGNTPPPPPPSDDMALVIQPNNTSIYVDQLINLDVFVQNAADLYGLQVECTTNATLLPLQQAEFGDFFDSSALQGINEISGDSGSWRGALSQRNPAPALDGNGRFATLTLQALAEGTVEVTCTPRASDGNGQELAITAASSTITIEHDSGGGTIRGSALYQTRDPEDGIQVSAIGATNRVTTTNESGQFALLNLQVGTYQIQAETPGHLYSCIDNIEVVADAPTIIPNPTTLLAGDVDANNEINILDAIAVGNVYLQPPAQGLPTDFNADGIVDVFDLTPLGRNFGESRTGCEDW